MNWEQVPQFNIFFWYGVVMPLMWWGIAGIILNGIDYYKEVPEEDRTSLSKFFDK